MQALYILLIGAISIAVYAVIVLTMSDSLRALAKYALTSILS